MNLNLSGVDTVVSFPSLVHVRKGDVAGSFVSAPFFFCLENTLLFFSSEIFEKSDGHTEGESATRSPVHWIG